MLQHILTETGQTTRGETKHVKHVLTPEPWMHVDKSQGDDIVDGHDALPVSWSGVRHAITDT